MEQRKNQFFIISILLLLIGFLQYFRKIANGYKIDRVGKILYLTTMVVFLITTMIVVYFTELNNVMAFCLGLLVTTSSEHIAKLFLTIGSNFNNIVAKIIKKYSGIDLTNELNDKNSDTANNKNNQ